MMRPFQMLLALVALAGAVPVARDWTRVVNTSPAGAFVIGNPAARVKLVEYASYTCPHCGAFSVQSRPVLELKLIRSGSTSLEFRPYVRDALDLSAAVLARCAGPAAFARINAAIFAKQDDWLPRGIEFQDANAARLNIYPVSARLRALAEGSGLTAIAASEGLNAAHADACFADGKQIERLIAMTDSVPAGFTGTPTFLINGKMVPAAASWDRLQPILRAAGAK